MSNADPTRIPQQRDSSKAPPVDPVLRAIVHAAQARADVWSMPTLGEILARYESATADPDAQEAA